MLRHLRVRIGTKLAIMFTPGLLKKTVLIVRSGHLQVASTCLSGRDSRS
jgi:hypothetical protein